MEIKLHYKDIVLDRPVFSEVESRSHISSDVKFLGYLFKSCAIPANMACVIDFKRAEQLSEDSYFYVLHRFYDYDEVYNWISKCQNNLRCISISVGVKDKDYDFITRLSETKLKVDFITIDIAFGHSSLMRDMIRHIKEMLPFTRIIAGNVCTARACEDLSGWGADAVKVGLSMGKACTTYNTTGVGSPMFSAVKDCALHSKVPIIADGGIRETGDYCKALVGGATMVMVGSKFVECKDSPATILYKGGTIPSNCTPLYKVYYGSASAKNKGSSEYVEGSEGKQLPYNPQTYVEYMDSVNQGIRSCMSYHNVTTPHDLIFAAWSVHYQ
jgi:GMP reductase